MQDGFGRSVRPFAVGKAGSHDPARSTACISRDSVPIDNRGTKLRYDVRCHASILNAFRTTVRRKERPGCFDYMDLPDMDDLPLSIAIKQT